MSRITPFSVRIGRTSKARDNTIAHVLLKAKKGRQIRYDTLRKIYRGTVYLHFSNIYLFLLFVYL